MRHAGRPKILLVEDNEDDRDLMELALQRSGVLVDVDLVVARDGVEALAMLLGEGAVKPDLVLLDLKLPRLSGLQVLQRLRGAPEMRGVPIVVLTTSREESDLLTSYGLGANSYVRKPINFSDFSETVGLLADYWLSLNERPPP